MSTPTSRVRSLLNDVETTRTGGGEGEEPERMTRSELKEAVKEGVSEALDEHEQRKEAEEADQTDEGAETESSGGRPIGKSVLLMALIAAAAFYARRRRGSDESEEF